MPENTPTTFEQWLDQLEMPPMKDSPAMARMRDCWSASRRAALEEAKAIADDKAAEFHTIATRSPAQETWNDRGEVCRDLAADIRAMGEESE